MLIYELYGWLNNIHEYVVLYDVLVEYETMQVQLVLESDYYLHDSFCLVFRPILRYIYLVFVLVF